MMNNDK